jgi:hypothetical protein
VRDGVGLYVAVVIFTCPHELAGPFERGCDHVVDEAVLVRNAGGDVSVFELFVENLLENILETTVVHFEDRVLRGMVHGTTAHQAVVQASRARSRESKCSHPAPILSFGCFTRLDSNLEPLVLV